MKLVYHVLLLRLFKITILQYLRLGSSIATTILGLIHLIHYDHYFTLQVFSIFMDTLVEVISIHKHMMHDWLYVLITKMLVKCGGEMLASVATKTSRTLDTIL